MIGSHFANLEKWGKFGGRHLYANDVYVGFCCENYIVNHRETFRVTRRKSPRWVIDGVKNNCSRQSTQTLINIL